MENVNVYEIHHGKCTLQLKMTDQGQISIWQTWAIATVFNDYK